MLQQIFQKKVDDPERFTAGPYAAVWKGGKHQSTRIRWTLECVAVSVAPHWSAPVMRNVVETCRIKIQARRI
jgi:hypothetical protein